MSWPRACIGSSKRLCEDHNLSGLVRPIRTKDNSGCNQSPLKLALLAAFLKAD